MRPSPTLFSMLASPIDVPCTILMHVFELALEHMALREGCRLHGGNSMYGGSQDWECGVMQ
jgi:hypothetical protein